MNSNRQSNRMYKDLVFRAIFGSEERKEFTLSLYNALNNSEHKNLDDLTFNTLEDVIYVNMKNDVSFLFCDTYNLYEHQSTCNPNMPARGMMYFSRLYENYMNSSTFHRYSSRLQPLPVPRFFVLWNGEEDQPDLLTLRLSDAFRASGARKDGEQSDIEVVAHVYNINKGHNQNLMEQCQSLSEYADLVDRIRSYEAQGFSFHRAVDQAVTDLIQQDGVLAPYLSKNRTEVTSMFLTEFNQEEYEADVRADGRAEERLKLISRMRSRNYAAEDIIDLLGLTPAEQQEFL